MLMDNLPPRRKTLATGTGGQGGSIPVETDYLWCRIRDGTRNTERIRTVATGAAVKSSFWKQLRPGTGNPGIADIKIELVFGLVSRPIRWSMRPRNHGHLATTFTQVCRFFGRKPDLVP